ncbi:MAG: PVC-type heme-binding CxxCH protein [Chthoniobacteraceae bacterium]
MKPRLRRLVRSAAVLAASMASAEDAGQMPDEKTPLTGLVVNGQPVVATRDGKDRGVRLLDVDHDGQPELLVGNETQNAVFAWSAEEKTWKRLPYPLPAPIVDAEGRDAGLRFADLNGDGFEDAIFSGSGSYSVHLFVPVEKKGVDWKLGWSLEMRAGQRGEPGEIPLIAGRGDAVKFRDGAMIVTAKKKEQRIAFEDLLRDPPPAPKSPADSIAAIRVAPGFTVELVASEPLTMDPIAFEWGADGKLWVLEMGDYPLGVDGQGKAGGVLRFLEDTNGDGRYDKSTVFLEALPFPSGMMPWRKGVLVAAAPDIFYAEDTDGDGKADKREVLFTGFTLGNQQHRINGFESGLDNWLYAANGDSGGKISSVRTGQTVDLSARDLRFRPDDGALELQPGRTQYGRHRDDWGNWFGGNNSTWAWHYFLPEHYLARNPHLVVKEARRTLATYPDPGRVFPISATMRRFNWPGKTNALTSGCSITPYRDELFGDSFARSIFICEPVNNLVHQEVLEPDGVTFTSHRPAGEEACEFLASSDNWSRFDFARTGPDGALYISDMYRLVIEHPEWIPAEQQKRLDLRAGHDKGRIYRVLPTGAKLRPIPRLDQLDTAALVAAMDSPSGWQRDTVQRLLLHTQPKAAISPLARFVVASERPKTRLQALCTLDGLGGLSAELLLSALRDPHPAVREHAIQLSEAFVGKEPILADPLLWLADDPEPRVRYQLAFSLGEWNDPRAGRALAHLARRDADNAQIQTAVMSSAPRHLGTMLEVLLAEKAAAPPPVIGPLLGLAVAMDESAALAKALTRMIKSGEGTSAVRLFPAISGLLDGVARKNFSLAKYEAAAPAELRAAIAGLDPAFQEAPKIALAPAAPEADRIVAIGLLGRGPRARGEEFRQLGELLRPSESAPIQNAALAALSRADGTVVPDVLIASWSSSSPALRLEALNLLFRKTSWIAALLTALEQGKLPPGQIDTAHQEKLLAHADPAICERATKLFTATNADRVKVVKEYAAVAELTGHPEKGAALFQQNCAICHRLRGVGSEVGPDLGMLADKPAAHFVEAIFDPNKAVESRYLSFTLTTKANRTLTGIIAAESPTSVVIRSPGGGEETVLRSDLQTLTGAATSLMPEGFEKILRAEDVADLIAYIRSSPASAPEAAK